jgi:hypothetical protein
VLHASRVVALLFFLGACHGGLHKKGERMWTVQGHYSKPILGNLLWWDGKGDAENVGVGVANRWFVQDRWAYGVGLIPTYFEENGASNWGLEFETGFRWYFWEIDRVGFFWDFNGGFSYATGKIPENGTEWNLTFGLGPGLEVQLPDRWALLGGVQLHHFSNGRGLNVADNPAQNEFRFWLGFGREW